MNPRLHHSRGSRSKWNFLTSRCREGERKREIGIYWTGDLQRAVWSIGRCTLNVLPPIPPTRDRWRYHNDLLASSRLRRNLFSTHFNECEYALQNGVALSIKLRSRELYLFVLRWLRWSYKELIYSVLRGAFGSETLNSNVISETRSDHNWS